MKLALAQIRVDGGVPLANLQRAEEAIGKAAIAGAKMILLPEALDCGWGHPSARQLAQSIPGGATCERLRECARRHGIYVCAGLVERAGESFYNAAVFISPAGALLLHHRKIHEIEFARQLYAKGDRLAVTETPWGVVGVMICADGFAPELWVSRTLALLGAKYILSPCAWAVPADHDQRSEPYGRLWRDCYGTVAREFPLSIAGASNVGLITAGEWSGRKCIGCSLVVGPGGAPVLDGPYGEDAEALLFVDLN